MPQPRYDAVQLTGRLERTDDGYLKGDAVVTRTGVFPYRMPNGDVIMELRHPDDVFSADALQSMQMLPVTLNHPVSEMNPSGMVTADNAKELSIGNLGENIQPDGRNVRATLILRDKAAIDQIQAGAQRECSMGYMADLLEEVGTYNGQPYDMRQTNIRYNHLAIVDRARVGAEARLNLDAAEQLDDAQHQITTGRGQRNMSKVRLDNGIEYDAAPEVAQELNLYRDRAKAAEGKLDTLTSVKLDGDATGKAEPDVAKHLGSVQGKLDATEAELKKLKEQGPQATADAARARLKLLNYGQSVLDAEQIKKLDEMSDSDIRKAVIVATTPEARRDDVTQLLDAKEKEGDAGAAYIEARFDAAVQDVNLRDSEAIIRQRQAVNGADAVQHQDAGDIPDADEHRKAMIDRYSGKPNKKGDE